MIPGM